MRQVYPKDQHGPIKRTTIKGLREQHRQSLAAKDEEIADLRRQLGEASRENQRLQDRVSLHKHINTDYDPGDRSMSMSVDMSFREWEEGLARAFRRVGESFRRSLHHAPNLAQAAEEDRERQANRKPIGEGRPVVFNPRTATVTIGDTGGGGGITEANIGPDGGMRGTGHMRRTIRENMGLQPQPKNIAFTAAQTERLQQMITRGLNGREGRSITSMDFREMETRVLVEMDRLHREETGEGGR